MLATVAALALSQVTPADDARLQAGLEEIKQIDAELSTIRQNRSFLATSKAARDDELSSLRLRYPEIAFPPHPSVDDIYQSLYVVRMERAKMLLPIARAKQRQINDQLCERLAAIEQSRRELEGTDGYKRASLQDRIELRKSLDDLIAKASASETRPCAATDQIDASSTDR